MLRIELKDRSRFEEFWRSFLLDWSRRNPENTVSKYDIAPVESLTILKGGTP